MNTKDLNHSTRREFLLDAVKKAAPDFRESDLEQRTPRGEQLRSVILESGRALMRQTGDQGWLDSAKRIIGQDRDAKIVRPISK